MIEMYFRPMYQDCIVNPIARRILIAPEKITYLACFSGILVAPALMFHFIYTAIILLLISGFFDTLDCTVARMTDGVSNVGSILDIMSDRIVEFSVIVGLFSVEPAHRAFATLEMLGSCYLCVTSFLVVGIFSSNQSAKSFYYSPGLIERAEAFLFFIAMIIWSNYFLLLAFLFTGLVLLTSYWHIKQFIDQLGSANK